MHCTGFLHVYWYVHTCIRTHIYAFCIHLGAGMVQVCPCIMGLLRLGMAAILAFAFEALMWEFLWFAGVVCTALVYVHVYVQVLLRCALAPAFCILHGAIYCSVMILIAF